MKTLQNPFTMTLLRLAVIGATATVMGCAPGLAGGWNASGHLGVADAFDLDLTFEDDTRGLAVYATVDSGEKAVPVCTTRFDDGKVSFVIDTAGGNSCSTLTRPLKFSGELGQDVMAGNIANADGEKVGIWRAYRKVLK